MSGAVTVLQRCSSDLKLNPHLLVVLLDGVYAPAAGLSFHPLSRLSTSEVADVLQLARVRMRIVALVSAPHSLARLLKHLGEPTEPPRRAAARGPPYFASQVVRRKSEEHRPQRQLFDE